MMVSVVIPVLNGEKYIERCINSILNQIYRDIEIIVVDNNSEDETINIIKRKMSEDTRIKLLKTLKKGVSIARNLGLENSNGEYVMFVDSDDTLDENAISQMIDIARKEKCEIIKCGYKFIRRKKINKYILKKGKCDFNREFWNNFFSTYNYNQVWGQMIKTQLCKKVKFDDSLAMAEDYLFNYNLYKRANSLYILNQPLYNYYYNEQGMNYNKNINKVIKKISDILSVCEKILKRETMYEKALYNRFLFEILPHLRDLSLNGEFNVNSLDFLLKNKFYIEALNNVDIKFQNSKLKYFLIVLLKNKKYNILNLYFKMNNYLKGWRAQ